MPIWVWILIGIGGMLGSIAVSYLIFYLVLGKF